MEGNGNGIHHGTYGGWHKPAPDRRDNASGSGVCIYCGKRTADQRDRYEYERAVELAERAFRSQERTWELFWRNALKALSLGLGAGGAAHILWLYGKGITPTAEVVVLYGVCILGFVAVAFGLKWEPKLPWGGNSNNTKT